MNEEDAQAYAQLFVRARQTWSVNGCWPTLEIRAGRDRNHSDQAQGCRRANPSGVSPFIRDVVEAYTEVPVGSYAEARASITLKVVSVPPATITVSFAVRAFNVSRFSLRSFFIG